jgi:F-type H+-transporting ATPase subunit a
MKMITNLFSIFDPSSRIISIVWLILAVPVVILTTTVWKKASSLTLIQNTITDKFKREVSYTLGKPTKGIEALIIIIFVRILLINVIALYPQNFSPTAHLPVTLFLSISVWITIVSFGWLKNTNHILSHLLPQGTPVILINFIVIIELVRNLIRPITLCVRLTANLIAGHLLISLLGNAVMSLRKYRMILAIPAPLVLTILEAAVACIQAYVFITLITLYTTEIK